MVKSATVNLFLTVCVCLIYILGRLILQFIMAITFLGILALVIWTTENVNNYKTSYSAYIVQETTYFNILAGIVLGIGFLPITIFMMYYSCSKWSFWKDTSFISKDWKWFTTWNSFTSHFLHSDIFFQPYIWFLIKGYYENKEITFFKHIYYWYWPI